jgi:hypothetical protein
MKYEQLIPPRAKTAIPPSALVAYEGKGWVVQSKKNGTNNVIVIDPDKNVSAHNRHGEPHKLWNLTEENSAVYRKFPGTGHWVLNAELIHSKVPGMRDINYVHDVLVADGKELWGTTYRDRLVILKRAFAEAASQDTWINEDTHLVVDKHTWLAVDYPAEFRDLFEKFSKPDDEGLVLKRLDGRLGLRDSSGCSWMVKCRRPNKNLSF